MCIYTCIKQAKRDTTMLKVKCQFNEIVKKMENGKKWKAGEFTGIKPYFAK